MQLRAAAVAMRICTKSVYGNIPDLSVIKIKNPFKDSLHRVLYGFINIYIKKKQHVIVVRRGHGSLGRMLFVEVSAPL